ncbi:MAG: DnaA regulatory inactivator Hda [Gammaproteobacteria bacterium]|nr:DnaA regulatory inactivator Hda [Gammaproteobacteria bacterium]
MTQQLTLDVSLDKNKTIKNFYAAGNIEAVIQLDEFVKNPTHHLLFLWGSIGVGKTHLLQAAANLALNINKRAIYLTLKNILSNDSEDLNFTIFDNLESMDLVCLDDIDSLKNNIFWQEQLFHLYNRCMENNCSLLLAASASLSALNLELADLESRVKSGLSYHLNSLTDENKALALQFVAGKRGLKLPLESVNYLIKRLSRDNYTLFSFLETLDQVSLAQKRNLTIPFIKSLL